VIVDDGSCEETGFDQACLPGADKAFGEGFAKHDVPSQWYMQFIWYWCIRANQRLYAHLVSCRQQTKVPVLFVGLLDAVTLWQSLGELPTGVKEMVELNEKRKRKTTRIDEL
jgi:hypothetical protein